VERVEVDGKALEVKWFARPVIGRPTIVLLHEALGSVAHWKRFPNRLADRCRCGVVAYSRAGYGRSQTLGAPREHRYLEREAQIVLPVLLEKLKIKRPMLFGHSDGASLALVFAGVFPNEPAGIVLEAPHVNVEPCSVTGIRGLKRAFESGDLRARLSAYHDDPDAAFYGWSNVWLDPDFASWTIERYLPAIRCPVLALQGTEDEFGTRVHVDAIARDARQTQVLMLEGCGHTPHREFTETVLEATAMFLDHLVAKR
jgi:pimeloyl-ACP methyl ester carboxylesterase